MALSEAIHNAISKAAASHRERFGTSRPKKKHVGFKGAEKSVESEGYSKKIAGAIIASRSRGASAAAKKANPHLNRVK